MAHRGHIASMTSQQRQRIDGANSREARQRADLRAHLRPASQDWASPPSRPVARRDSSCRPAHGGQNHALTLMNWQRPSYFPESAKRSSLCEDCELEPHCLQCALCPAVVSRASFSSASRSFSIASKAYFSSCAVVSPLASAPACGRQSAGKCLSFSSDPTDPVASYFTLQALAGESTTGYKVSGGACLIEPEHSARSATLPWQHRRGGLQRGKSAREGEGRNTQAGGKSGERGVGIARQVNLRLLIRLPLGPLRSLQVQPHSDSAEHVPPTCAAGCGAHTWGGG